MDKRKIAAQFNFDQYNLVVFYENGEAEIWMGDWRSGGVAASRNPFESMNPMEEDQKFLSTLKSITMPYGVAVKLTTYLKSLGWANAACNSDQEFYNRTYGVWEPITAVYSISNRVDYNTRKTTFVSSSYEEALELLAACSNWRPNGKAPLLGSGIIYEIVVYCNNLSKELKYKKIPVFCSRMNCVNIPVDLSRETISLSNEVEPLIKNEVIKQILKNNNN